MAMFILVVILALLLGKWDEMATEIKAHRKADEERYQQYKR